jgi:hypothetical protein
VDDQARSLTKGQKRALAKFDVRLGLRWVSAASLLSPQAMALRALFWSVWKGLDEALPAPAAAPCVRIHSTVPYGFWIAIAIAYVRVGHHVLGIDIFEKVAAAERARRHRRQRGGRAKCRGGSDVISRRPDRSFVSCRSRMGGTALRDHAEAYLLIPLVFGLLTVAHAEDVPTVEPAGECLDYCADPSQLVHFEAQATRGAMPKSDIDCLETRYAACETMTTKDKISRVLLVNAYALDSKLWATLVQRHLDEVDRSDPNIAFLYSYYLHNNGAASAEEVIQWTNVGLERKQEWTGNTYVSRVYSLMKLRATAAGMIWGELEKAMVKSPDDGELRAKLESQRNRTKTFSREWLDFARVSGEDTAEAEELCLSAGSAKACIGEPG